MSWSDTNQHLAEARAWSDWQDALSKELTAYCVPKLVAAGYADHEAHFIKNYLYNSTLRNYNKMSCQKMTNDRYIVMVDQKVMLTHVASVVKRIADEMAAGAEFIRSKAKAYADANL